jgi:hypothetical protein
MPAGHASESKAASEAVLREAALALASRIEALDDLAAGVDDL